MRHSTLSLNARVAVSAGLVLAVFIMLTGLALERAFHESARAARQERLLGQLYLLIAAAEVDAAGKLSMPATVEEARFNLPGSGLYAQISDDNGRAMWRSSSALSAQPPFQIHLPAGENRFEERTNSARHPFFVQSLGVNWATGRTHHAFVFSVSEDLTEFNAQIARYRENLWGWLGVMALLLLAAQVLVLRWGLRPLRNVAQELAAIEAGQQERLQGTYPREIKKLTDNLNALLQQERAQQKRYRDALADLAHSLKTPLAVMRGALQNGQTLAAAVEEEVTRMNRIVEYQLQRAATTAPTKLAAPLLLAPLAAKIISSLDKVYHDKGVEARVSIEAQTSFRGDEGDMLELLGNLLDNAYKWCRKAVRLSAVAQDGNLVISVEDDGPGMDAAEAQSLLQRGVRADQAVPGHGIGLAVVRDIVEAYQGEIRIEKSPLGGAQIRVILPRR